MKRISAFLCSVMLFLATALTALPAVHAIGTNLVANPSAETASGTLPASWSQDKWGTNTTAFTYATAGHTGSRSLTTKMTAYTSGDAKWDFTSVAVTPNTSYTFSDWYQSDIVSNVDLVVTSTTGVDSYIWLDNPVVSAAWKQNTYTFTTPANAAKVTVYHSISKVGQLTVDDYSLATTAGTTPTPTPSPTPAPTPAPSPTPSPTPAPTPAPTPSPTPAPTPTPTPTAPSVSITAPAANATVTGTSTLSANAATASGTVTSVQFKIDGNNIGTADTTSPYSASWDSKTASDGVHGVTAVATNSSNLSTTSTAVSVNVSNPVTPPTTNLITNPSAEDGTTTPTGWSDGGWGTNTHTNTYEATGHTGTKSLKAAISAYTNGDAKWISNSAPVTANTTYKFSNWYKSNVATELDAMVTMTDGTVQYFYLTASPASSTTWSQQSLQFTAPTGAASLTIFQVIAKVGYVQTDDYSLTTYVPAKLNRPLISLTFDDGWRNIATAGLPVLKKYSLVSTQYLNSTPVIGGYPDYMTYAQIKSFAAQGSELAWHTRSHADITTLTSTQLNTELTIPTAFLTGTGTTAATYKNFASPYGAYNTTSVNKVKTLYRSHRSTDVGYNGKDDFNIYNIKVQNITNTTTPATVQGWVNQAKATNTWLVIVYHEVTATAADPTYAVTPANLDAELNIVKQSTVTVKTLDQALDEVLPQL